MKIPVKATYEKINGEMVQVAAEYAEIPAEVIAEYIIIHYQGTVPAPQTGVIRRISER